MHLLIGHREFQSMILRVVNRSSDCRELIELGMAWRGYDLQVRFFLEFYEKKRVRWGNRFDLMLGSGKSLLSRSQDNLPGFSNLAFVHRFLAAEM